MKRIWWLLALIATLTVPTGLRAEGGLSDAPVIRKPLEWRAGRFALTPVIGTTVNDPYFTTMLVGATVDYHILEWLAVGIDFRWGVGFTNPLLDQIESDIAKGRGRGEVEGDPDLITSTHINWLVTGNVQFIPIYGKFVLFDSWQFAYDLHLLLGVGYAGTVSFPDDSTKRQVADSKDGSVAPVAGVGFRIFVSDWLALNFEFRDYLVSMVRVVPEYPKGGDRPGKSFEHNFAVAFGFTFMLPTEITNADD